MSLIHCFECKPSVSFTSLTSVLCDGRDLAITVTDVRQKPRQTARSWTFDWCQVWFADDKLTEKALVDLPQKVQDRYALIVSKIEAKDSDPKPLSLWIPVCYLPPSMLVHFHQQLISRHKLLELMSSDSESDPVYKQPTPEPMTSSQPTGHCVSKPTPMNLTIAKSSAMGSRHGHTAAYCTKSPSPRPPVTHLGFLDLVNADHSYSGKGTWDEPILLE